MTVEGMDTVVIGAGQAGLAAGYELRRQRRNFIVAEAGSRIGESWRGRWDSLRLFTPPAFNSLPGMPAPVPEKDLHTKDEIADYLEAYAAGFDIPVRLGTRVNRLWRDGNRYLISTGEDLLTADHVIIATGPYSRPHIPGFAAQLDPAITQLHSSGYRNAGQLRDGAVLVVGAGNSGAEIALELAAQRPTWLAGPDTGHVPVRMGVSAYRLMTRLSVHAWPGRMLADLGSRGGHPLIRVAPQDLLRSSVWRAPRVTGVVDGLPRLADGRVLPVENVVWCTGFTRDYRWIDVPAFTPDGRPVHHRGVVRSEPGLYFVGLPFQSSLASHLLGGVAGDAQYIVGQLIRRTKHRKEQREAHDDHPAGLPHTAR